METLRVLDVFLQAPNIPQYGLELAEAAGLPRGSIYPMLARLEKGGWLESFWEDIDPMKEGRRARRYYKLTATGFAEASNAKREAARFLSLPEEGLWTH